ncbi:MAG TPA: c-type cytochrome [Solirubrobacteraceae bacterium]
MLARIDRVLAPVTWVVAAFAVLVLLVGPQLIGAQKSTAAGGGGGGATGGAPPSGAQVFSSAGCGGCHTLKAAGSNGTTGPDLDAAKPAAAAVAAIVRSGAGIMPSFSGRLSDAQIQAVAQYVSGSAGG